MNLSSLSLSYVTTDGQSASLSWCQAPIWGLRPDFYYRQTVAGFLTWGALPDARTGLPFSIAASLRQCMNLSSLHGTLYSLVHIHGECLLPGCCHGNMFTEPLPINGLPRLFVAVGTCVWASSWLAMYFRYGSIIPAFRRHVTILKRVFEEI
jgi:hypothetical protein